MKPVANSVKTIPCSMCSKVHQLTGVEHCLAVILAKEFTEKMKKAEEEKTTKTSELTALSYNKVVHDKDEEAYTF